VRFLENEISGSPASIWQYHTRWEDIKTLLDNAITIKPKRQMSVQFSGGEPTLSPYFLDAVRYALDIIPRRFRSYRSSRYPSRDATRRSPTNAARRSATRSRIWRTM
jgi:hypothetical protein